MEKKHIVVNSFEQPNQELLDILSTIGEGGLESAKGEFILVVDYKYAKEPVEAKFTYDLPKIGLENVTSTTLAIYLLSHASMVVDKKVVEEVVLDLPFIKFEDWLQDEEPAFFYASSFGSELKDIHYHSAARRVIHSLGGSRMVSCPIVVLTEAGDSVLCGLSMVDKNNFEILPLQTESGVEPKVNMKAFIDVRGLIYKTLSEIQQMDTHNSLLSAIDNARLAQEAEQLTEQTGEPTAQ